MGSRDWAVMSDGCRLLVCVARCGYRADCRRCRARATKRVVRRRAEWVRNRRSRVCLAWAILRCRASRSTYLRRFSVPNNRVIRSFAQQAHAMKVSKFGLSTRKPLKGVVKLPKAINPPKATKLPKAINPLKATKLPKVILSILATAWPRSTKPKAAKRAA